MSLDWRLEVAQVPVADVDRSRAFYTDRMGFVLDHDVEVRPGVRVVQLTPPGSACSIVIGTGVTDVAPGNARLQLVFTDMDAAVSEAAARGLDLGEVQVLGREGHPGFKHAFVNDPDGNVWTIQELP